MNRYTLLAALWLSVTATPSKQVFHFVLMETRKMKRHCKLLNNKCLVNKRDTYTTYSRHLI
jgi:hypothetical protein